MNDIIPTEQALERATALNLLTPTGLTLPDEPLSELDTYCLGVQLSTTETAVGWGRGDLALYIKLHYPDRYYFIWRDVFPGRALETLHNDSRTASLYTTEERYRYCVEDGLSFGHCQKAGHLPNDQREDALLMARDNGWNVRQLEAYIYNGHTLPPIATPSRDVKYMRDKVNEWIDAVVEDEDHKAYSAIVCMFLDWLESNT